RRTVIDPTMALRELSLPRADLAKVEPGLAKLPAPLAAVFADPGPSPDDDRRRRLLDKALGLLGILHKAGVPIVAGTDQAVPGHSLHRELELYVQAGFTPLEAIQSATLVPARAMHLDKEVGTIEPGKRADLVVLGGDPIADIHNIRKIETVIARGKTYEPGPLWRLIGFSH